MSDQDRDRDQRDPDSYEDLDPFEIEFLPEFTRGRGPRAPFVNRHGVIIGDHMYESDNSPLQQWSDDTDPSVMMGDEWVHPFKDIGFTTAENRDYFERGISPQAGVFMHPYEDVAYNGETGERHTDSEDAEDDQK
ncbi:DUF3905 domain-containing protein [Paenibacillus tarimensis]